MPAYSFQPQFIPSIESGAKTHTIRGKRKSRPQPGQRFVAYTGMRTKACRKLFESTITSVQEIEIRASAMYCRVWIDGELLSADEVASLALRDGFRDTDHFASFWIERYEFEGDLIHWKPVPR